MAKCVLKIRVIFKIPYFPPVEGGECPEGTFATDNGVFCCNAFHKVDYTGILEFNSSREDCPGQEGVLCPQVPETSCARIDVSKIECELFLLLFALEYHKVGLIAWVQNILSLNKIAHLLITHSEKRYWANAPWNLHLMWTWRSTCSWVAQGDPRPVRDFLCFYQSWLWFQLTIVTWTIPSASMVDSIAAVSTPAYWIGTTWGWLTTSLTAPQKTPSHAQNWVMICYVNKSTLVSKFLKVNHIIVLYFILGQNYIASMFNRYASKMLFSHKSQGGFKMVMTR